MRVLIITVFLATSSLWAGTGPFGTIFNQSQTFTRPGDTTAYASGDQVANSTTAGSVTPMTFTVGGTAVGAEFVLERIKLAKSTTSVTNASFRVHLWSASPTVAAGDNAAMSTSGTATYLGYYDVTIDKAFTDGSAGFVATLRDNAIVLTTQYIYGLLEAQAAYSPGNAETFTVTIEGYLNR
jgi:hypothetical protein